MERILSAASVFNGAYCHTPQALNAIEDTIVSWLRNDNQDLLIYDRTWGALVTYQGLNDVNADFGNAWNNDKVSLPCQEGR